MASQRNIDLLLSFLQNENLTFNISLPNNKSIFATFGLFHRRLQFIYFMEHFRKLIDYRQLVFDLNI